MDINTCNLIIHKNIKGHCLLEYTGREHSFFTDAKYLRDVKYMSLTKTEISVCFLLMLLLLLC